jgi:predicted O-linked N-acetylglucosamine transferase (SPINDLY family)
LPALSNGFVTFASMNNFKKVNDRVINLWTKIMNKIPNSRLILSVKGDSTFHKTIFDRFALRGISADRIKIIGILPLSTFLEVFSMADISLDPFPFSGCITVYHGLYCGVPSIVLQGQSEYERNGSAVMKKCGLSEFIAKNEDEYANIAVRFSNDLQKLSEIRNSIPEKLKKDAESAESITRNIEKVFVEML